MGPVELSVKDPWRLEAGEAVTLDGALWVDARSALAFGEGHVPGAVHLDPEDWESGLSIVLTHRDPGTVLIVYCGGAGCEESRAMAEDLREALVETPVYWVDGGWKALSREVFP